MLDGMKNRSERNMDFLLLYQDQQMGSQTCSLLHKSLLTKILKKKCSENFRTFHNFFIILSSTTHLFNNYFQEVQVNTKILVYHIYFLCALIILLQPTGNVGVLIVQ